MITKDGRYLHAAENSFQFLTMPQGEGGTLTNMADLNPSLYKYIFFEEYFSKPNGYTLNGFMFTLLGIYDLWQLK